MIFGHIFLFIVGCAVMWISSEFIVSTVQRLSRVTKISTFATSLFLLGILTSLTELSVGINAVIEKRPGIFAGNLIGGSFVIFLLILPLLAIFNNGIRFKKHLGTRRLFFLLVLVAAPAFTVLNGSVTVIEAVILLILFTVFTYLIQREEQVREKIESGMPSKSILASTVIKIIIGSALIFIASKLLISETIYFAELLRVPTFLISLLVLSLGTNLPEIFIAVNSIRKRHIEIAFGDYIGSAAVNTLLFAVFTIAHGTFSLTIPFFYLIFFIILGGYVLFFIFARSKNTLSLYEGIPLIIVYIIFLLTQVQELLESFSLVR